MVIFTTVKKPSKEAEKNVKIFLDYLQHINSLPDNTVVPKRIHEKNYGDFLFWTFAPLIPKDFSKDRFVQLVCVDYEDKDDVGDVDDEYDEYDEEDYE